MGAARRGDQFVPEQGADRMVVVAWRTAVLLASGRGATVRKCRTPVLLYGGTAVLLYRFINL